MIWAWIAVTAVFSSVITAYFCCIIMGKREDERAGLSDKKGK